MLNKYIITHSNSEGKVKSTAIFAGDEETALSIFRANFGPHPEARAILLREATKLETEQLAQAGGRSLRGRNV